MGVLGDWDLEFGGGAIESFDFVVADQHEPFALLCREIDDPLVPRQVLEKFPATAWRTIEMPRGRSIVMAATARFGIRSTELMVKKR
jgi:hypothetical protein